MFQKKKKAAQEAAGPGPQEKAMAEIRAAIAAAQAMKGDRGSQFFLYLAAQEKIIAEKKEMDRRAEKAIERAFSQASGRGGWSGGVAGSLLPFAFMDPTGMTLAVSLSCALLGILAGGGVGLALAGTEKIRAAQAAASKALEELQAVVTTALVQAVDEQPEAVAGHISRLGDLRPELAARLIENFAAAARRKGQPPPAPPPRTGFRL